MKWYHWLELVAASVVLASAGWEIFLSEPLEAMAEDFQLTAIEDRLRVIDYRLAGGRVELTSEDGDAHVISEGPEDRKQDIWLIAKGTVVMDGNQTPQELDNQRNLMRESIERTSRQVTINRVCRGIVFIAGSLLLIVARGFDLRAEHGS